MQYMGGKGKISKDISGIINRHTEGNKPFVSLFCGSCAIESKVNSPHKICNDKHEYLIAMWQALQDGYELPEDITREQYNDTKNNLERDKALSGFVGFACGFGGKWYGGYAFNSKGDNYAIRGKRSILKDFEGLKTAQFTQMDYSDVGIPDGAIIYADPPYMNTTGYSTNAIDYNAFWEYMRKLSENHVVLISEEQAPKDFICIWEKSFTRTLDVNKSNQPKKIEKLFIHKSRYQCDKAQTSLDCLTCPNCSDDDEALYCNLK